MNNDDLLINKVFIDITNGYSYSDSLFVKHLNIFDNYKIQLFKDESYKKGLEKGLPLESVRLSDLKKQDIWKDQDEEFLLECKTMIDGLDKSKKDLFLPSQIKQKEEEKKEWEQKYLIKLDEKNNLLGLTAEKYAEKKSFNYYIYNSLYTDENLKCPYFNFEKFNNLDEEELYDIILKFNEITSHINIQVIKKAALDSTFQSLYSINDNSYYFFEKKTASLTFYQTNFLSYLKYYSHILSEIQDKIPDNFKNDPDKLEQLYISIRNIDREKSKRNNSSNLEFFGTTEEDSKILGNNSENDKIDEMLQRGENFNLIDIYNKK